MSELQQAVEELKAAARPFRAMLALVDRLDGLGDIEQVERETRARVDALKADEAEIARRIEVVQARVTAAEREAAGIVERAKGEAVEIRDRSEREGCGIIERAESLAHSIREAANHDASAARAEADAARADAQTYEQQVRDLEERLSAARSAIASLVQGAAG